MAGETDGVDFLRDGGEMGAAIRAHDWSRSSLGHPATWPQSLRTVIRLMLNSGHPIYVWWGPELACFYNDAYSRSIGPERHPGSLGRPAREVWAEIWPIIGPQIEQVMSGGGATWHENQLVPITRHGRREDVYWTYSYSPIDEPAAPLGVGGVLVLCTETTDQVIAARDLATDRDRLARLFEQAPGFMAVLHGPDHRFELANPAYRTVVGGRDVIGKTVAEALPETVDQGFLALLDQVFTTGSAYVARAAKYHAPEQSGGPDRERFVDFVYQPIKDDAGSVTGIFVEGSDVTDRTRADAALRLLEPRLRGLLETIPGFIWTADATGEIDYISPRYQEFVGRPESKFKRAFWHEFVHPEDLPHVFERWARAGVDRATFTNEARVLRHDGVFRWLAISAEPELGPDGEILRWFGFADDTHDQKEIAQALQHSEARYRAMAEELSEANRRKDQFLATLAHELRNPLAPILNALALMKHAPHDGKAAVSARERIERQIGQMVRLIDDLLDLSRVSRGIVELQRSHLPLARALRDAIETSRPLIEQAGHCLQVTLPSEPLALEGDPTRIVQVFANLLNNAAKFTPPGGRIEIVLAREGVDRACVTVRDSGQGIPEDMLDRIFDLFTQVDRSHARVGGGLGIGLTLVRQLIEMHGGSIEARSAGPGRGSEFLVHLPLTTAAEPAADTHEPQAWPATPPSHRRRILVADDNTDAAETLSDLLQLLGYETYRAHDGEQALALAREVRPDAMVLDIAMPKLSGHDLARTIRKEPWGASVLLIASSGWGQPENQLSSRRAGFDHHLVKPVDITTLEKLLARD